MLSNGIWREAKAEMAILPPFPARRAKAGMAAILTCPSESPKHKPRYDGLLVTCLDKEGQR